MVALIEVPPWTVTLVPLPIVAPMSVPPELDGYVDKTRVDSPDLNAEYFLEDVLALERHRDGGTTGRNLLKRPAKNIA